MKIGLFTNSSQVIGSKRLKFQGLMGSHWDGVVMRKFGEDQSKTMPMGLFFF